MMKRLNNQKFFYLLTFGMIVVLGLGTITILYGAAAKWIQVGNLHNFYQEHGCEPEEDFGTEQQFGLRWPGFYWDQDCQAAKGLWIGVRNFDDPLAGKVYPHKVIHCGPRPRPEIVENEFMPIPFDQTGTGLKLYGRIEHPLVYVDNMPATDLTYNDIVEVIDPSLKVDRMMANNFHTSVGISCKRKIYAYSHAGYDNFHIQEFVFTNTGICSKDESLTHNQTLEDVYFQWQYRYAICGEGTVEGTGINWRNEPGWGTPRDMRWGINTMNEVIGEHPDNPRTNSRYPGSSLLNKFDFGVDEYDHNSNPIRAFYTWHGRHSETDYDNIGSPNVYGYKADGRLGATQFVGVVTLHADKSPDDHSNDFNQPSTAVKIESNCDANFNNNQFNEQRMTNEYQDYCAFGYRDLSQAEEVGDKYANQAAEVGLGGFSQSIAFGPYTLEPGDSVRIVWAEAANGLARNQGHYVGRNWYRVFKQGKSISVEMPDPNNPQQLVTKDITDEDEANDYKNSWVYTGKDSLMNTYRKAIDVFNQDFDLENQYPPDPPREFLVESQGNRIYLTWADNAESHPRFEGYRIYRAQGKADSTYYLIADLNKTDGNIAHEYSDYNAVRGQGYFYYISAYDDGSTNNGVPLLSSPFWTRTNKAAYLLKPPSETLADIRIVPNPYNIRNTDGYQYSEEPYKVMFLNLPFRCKIRIFTERGDLIYKMNHEGSGDARWDLITDSRQIVVSGVYIVHFEVDQDIRDPFTNDLIISKGTSTYRKMVIIR